MEIQGRAALITGGASGLGEAVARRLSAAGARVVIADVQVERGRALARELGATFSECDVRDEAQVSAALALATPLRAVVQCAGVALAKRTLDKQGVPHELAAFERVHAINVLGTFNVARLAAAVLAKQEPDASGQRGVLVQTASIAAYEGQTGQAAYASSKGALVAMTLPLARDLAQHGIRVCTLCPGCMDTPLLHGLPEPARTALEANIPFPSRLGLPAEFAALVEHVIANDYLNGETIRLDGALRMGAR